MAEYQKVEYRIKKDGTIVETVIDAAGSSCIQTTAAMEQALGQVEGRELLPAYYEEEDSGVSDTVRSQTYNS